MGLSKHLATHTIVWGALAATVNAELIDLGTITRDTTTGLDWLDVPLTGNLTPLEALDAQPGFRHATREELDTLFFESFGLQPGTTVPKDPQAKVLIDLFGSTGTGNADVDGTAGAYATGVCQITWTIHGDGKSSIICTDGGALPFTRSAHRGTWLVAVPEPTTEQAMLVAVLLLFGFALAIRR